jgi:hypothetical protein
LNASAAIRNVSTALDDLTCTYYGGLCPQSHLSASAHYQG